MRSINSESDFQLGSGVCAIKFSAEWCGPCKKMEPMVEKLESEFKNEANFFSVDIDDVPSIAQKYKVRTLPTVLILKDGQEVNRVTGVSLIEPLRKIFRDVISG